MAQRKPTGRELVAGVGFFALGLAGATIATDYPLGTLRVPGPGALPLALSVLIALFALWFLLRPQGPPPPAHPTDVAPTGLVAYARIVLAVLCIAAWVGLIDRFGFVVTTVVAMAVLHGLAAPRPWRLRAVISSLLAGSALTAAAYLLFVMGLGVRLPVGTVWG